MIPARQHSEYEAGIGGTRWSAKRREGLQGHGNIAFRGENGIQAAGTSNRRPIFQYLGGPGIAEKQGPGTVASTLAKIF